MRYAKVHFDQEKRDFKQITKPQLTPTMKKTNSLQKDQFLLTITTPARDLTSIQHFKSLIDPLSHYQVIPNVPQTLACNIQHFIEAAAEASRDKVLDVTLPFQKLAKEKLTQYYFGRYIFKDRKLLAVRLASSEKQKFLKYPCSNIMKWPKKVVEKISISFQLKQYYKKSGIIAQEVVPVGDFVLKMNNACFGLLFQSQLNQDPRLLIQYNRLGVNILSVIDDVPNEFVTSGKTINYINYNNYKASTPSANKIKRQADMSIIAYTGVRYSPLNCIYLTLPFIQENDKSETGSFSIWKDCNLSMKCQIPRFIKRMENGMIDLELLEVIETQQQLPLLGQQKVQKISKAIINNELSAPEIISKKNGDLKPLLNLIYLYKHANQLHKFTVPVNVNRSFLVQLSKLAIFLGRPIGDIVNAYQMKSPVKSSQPMPMMQNMLIYSSLEVLAGSMPTQRVCVYSDEITQKYQNQKIATSHPNITIFSQYLTSIFDYGLTPAHRSTQIQKINQFVDSVIQQRVYDLKQILKLARSRDFQLDLHLQVEAITLKLKDRLRQCYLINPLSEYLLQKDSEILFKQLVQTEVSLAQNQEGIRMHQIDENVLFYQKQKLLQNLQQSSNLEKGKNGKGSSSLNSFQKMFKIAKQIKSRSHNKQLQCHNCLTFMQNSFFYTCQYCKTETCYPCIGQIFKPISCKQKESFQYCLVCLKLCKCKKCENVSKRSQNQNCSQKAEKISQSTEQSCSRCDVIGRKSENIRILCSICNFNQCWKCAKDSSKLKTGYQWMCDSCRPKSPIKSTHSSKNSEMNQQKADDLSQKNSKQQKKQPPKQATIMEPQLTKKDEENLNNQLKVTSYKKKVQIYLSNFDRNNKNKTKLPSPPQKSAKNETQIKTQSKKQKRLSSSSRSQSSSRSYSSSHSSRSYSSQSSRSPKGKNQKKQKRYQSRSRSSSYLRKPEIKKYQFKSKYTKKQTKQHTKFTYRNRRDSSSNSKKRSSYSRSSSSSRSRSRSRSSSNRRFTKKSYKKDGNKKQRSHSKQRRQAKPKEGKMFKNDQNVNQNESKGLWKKQPIKKSSPIQRKPKIYKQEGEIIEEKYYTGKILNLSKYVTTDNIDY